ncbi:hypothetical protein EV210_10740 [Anaerospora hongkongensis]|uniref:Uncharacterized protein n=1 Tax=Anaerospora hongkongensis TaxID=244830 RepID=A0A4R1Q6B0_9FIRM|nr:hypothetical protein [Anaerospora hongkongensis]TCL36778.1 hypothetical protein EV210_10740 [Anaerospora hongkongensis]
MENCREVTRDIVVKMIEHGSFDELPTAASEAGTFQSSQLMAMQICKVYEMLFETISRMESSSQDQELYLAENQT